MRPPGRRFVGIGYRKPLPSPQQAAKGVSLSAANAWAHIECAEALREAGYLGPASAHLVLAVEEAVKARVFYLWPALKKVMREAELRGLLYTHPVRHGIAVHDSMPRSLRTAIALWQIDHPGKSIDRKSLARLFARHAGAFPLSWAVTADRDKQRGMHVDWDGRSWRTPTSVTEPQFRRRRARCVNFVLSTLAAVGEFDQVREELADGGWDINEDRM